MADTPPTKGGGKRRLGGGRKANPNSELQRRKREQAKIDADPEIQALREEWMRVTGKVKVGSRVRNNKEMMRVMILKKGSPWRL